MMDKLNSLFKEEQWGRIEPKDIGISRFKILDDFFNIVVSQGLINETLEESRGHLNDHKESITACYLVGLIGYHLDKIEDSIRLRELIDLFMDNHKWAVVEVLSEKILEYGESSVAFRALAISLERLGRSKEAIPVLENLLKIDRFDAEVSRKLSLAIIDENPEKSIHYMKLSIEGFIKNGDFDEVTGLWNKLAALSWTDMPFFERIERMLVDARQTELVSTLFKILLQKFRDDDENVDIPIDILKKILKYKPAENNARKDLIKFYKKKYGVHSQFSQFLKLSKLDDNRVPVKYAIQDFEKNIIFDLENYVYHNSWQLGKITDIDESNLTISFNNKPDHKMSFQMALQSLMPVSKDHIYVVEYEDPELIGSLFTEDIMQFFLILIKSYGGKISQADIKYELIPKYVKEKDWAKWWSKARVKIKKDPLFGVSDKKKDEIYLREKPLTYADELLDRFIKADSFSDRLDTAVEFINNVEWNDGGKEISYFIDYFIDEAKGNSSTRLILSYFILKDIYIFSEMNIAKLDAIKGRVTGIITESSDLHQLSIKINSYDYKKQLVNLIEEHRKDWPKVVSAILFELPIRIHKYIINTLIRAKAYNVINDFIDKLMTSVKQYPEIFFWIAKNLLTKAWDYDWLDYSRKGLVLSFFRLMNELKKIETDGNRMKNLCMDLLFSNENLILKEIIRDHDKEFIGKIFELFNNLTYVEQTKKDKFLALVIEAYAGFKAGHNYASDEGEGDIERLIVTKAGFDRKKSELDKMVNVDMAALSRELSKVSEVSGDLRENVEYNALTDKQAILKSSITRLDEEIKKADILNVDTISILNVNIGTRVKFSDLNTGEVVDYVILGPWDADFATGVLSYRSPIAKSILGKKVNDEVEFKLDDETKKFRILSIDKYI